MKNIKIFLHIGHDKTGTSAIQSYLAKNAALLNDFGIEYPYHDSFIAAEKGEISTGNGHLYLGYKKPAFGKKLLFSSEVTFWDVFHKGKVFEKIREQSKDVNIIIYTRDLFDHFSSSWGQYIKRGGGKTEIGEFSKYYAHYSKVLSVINSLQEIGANFTIRNYSNCKDRLEQDFIKIILPTDADAFLQQASRVERVVNRSLTLAEYELQRLFNIHLGQESSVLISDALVNHLPRIRAEKPNLDEDTIGRVLERNRAAGIELNKFLHADDQLNLDPPTPRETDKQNSAYGFSTSQLEVIVKSICQILKRPTLSDEDVNLIRDTAMSYESRKSIGKEQAIELMSLAAKARPGGPFIQRKLKAWKESGA